MILYMYTVKPRFWNNPRFWNTFTADENYCDKSPQFWNIETSILEYRKLDFEILF